VLSNNNSKSKLHPQRNLGHVKIKECLPSFNSKSCLSVCHLQHKGPNVCPSTLLLSTVSLLFPQCKRPSFMPRGKKGTGGWRKLYNEQRHALHSTQNVTRIIISRRMRWVCTRGGNACRVLARKREGKEQLGTPSHR
jgi:hypothetical protein